MQRKKFLALMLATALAGQPSAAMPVLAAEVDTEAEGAEDFGSGGAAEEEKDLPVILSDLPAERIIYYHNEKASPLKIEVEDGENLRYLWLESDDNETFSGIKKADTDQDRQEEGSGQSETGSEEEQMECTPEYTPPTDTPGSFFYKVRIWKQDEADEETFVESRTVCIQVLEEEQEKDSEESPEINPDERSGEDTTASEENESEEDTGTGSESETGTEQPDKDDEDAADTDSEIQPEDPDADTSTDGDASANTDENTSVDAETSTDADDPEDTEDPANTNISTDADDSANADTSTDADVSANIKDTADTEDIPNTEDMPNTDISTDTAVSENTEDISDTDSSADQEPEDLPTEETKNHLPVRNADIPETENYETEGYWNVNLNEIFQDPDGDSLTYYEKGDRDEEWTPVEGDSYLCHLKNSQETYIFTAKDQEDYGEIYAVTLRKKTETEQPENTDVEAFSAGEAKAASTQKVSFATAYKRTGEHLAAMAEKNAPVNGPLCGEWMVIGLVRSGQSVDSSVYSRYKSSLVDTVKEKKGVLHQKKYTEYSRAVLALTALGEDVTDVGGYNLLKPLADFDQTIWQGVNGTIWALLAFDSHDYEIPEVEAGKTQTTREKLIGDILSKEVSGGGWSMMGGADSDVTGMALQALAPYYNSNSSVKAAVDRAVKKLSSMQFADGTFGTMGNSTSESCSQVVTGLSALGIDCNKDSRFIKNGNSLLQGLLSYYDGNGGFLHVADNGYDQMATEQAYYAMTAYSRMKNGKTFLYDMTDVAIKSDREKADEVTKLIEALPSKITMSNFQQVKTAYAAYNGLNSTQKAVITKAGREKLLNAYRTAQELEVQYVENLIRKIGKVTLASEEKITDAKIAYNSLSSAQQKKVSNYDVLVNAEKELQKLKKPTTTVTPVPGTTSVPQPTSVPGTTSVPKPSGAPGPSVNLVTPKPTVTPSAVKTVTPTPTEKPVNPTPTVTQAPAAQPSRTKTAGGSTKSASVGSGNSSKTAASGSTKKVSAGNKNTSASDKKTSSEKKTSGKNTDSSLKTGTKETQTEASRKVINEMKAFSNTKGSGAYPKKIDDYTDRQIKELGKVWKNYEKLSAAEKKAVQENTAYKSFRKLLTSLGEKYHFDQATGTNLTDNKEDILPWYVQMAVNPKMADDNEIQTIQKVLGEKSEVLSLNEIHFVDTLTGDNWEPEDVLKVQLPMADLGDYKSCMIVHITDEGKVEFLKGKISGDYISFDAAEFSAYGIVGFMGNSDEILSGQEDHKPVWPWIAAGGAACVLVILMGGIRIMGSRKKKGEKK